MISVFLLQWQRLRRAPILVLSFLGLTILFVSVLAGFGGPNSQFTIYTYGDPTLEEENRDKWLDRLNEEGNLTFHWVEESEAVEAVTSRSAGMALKLMNDDYQILIAVQDPSSVMIENYVYQVFSEELRLQEVASHVNADEFYSNLDKVMSDPTMKVTTESLSGEESSYAFDERLHFLFGMTLFFSIYTMMYSLMNVAEEKRVGTWDRLIVSPLYKWQVYTGHLLYSFLIGMIQIVVAFLFFQVVFGFDLGERYGTLLLVIGCFAFAIVSLGMLVMGLVKRSQQMQAVIPILATAMAMLGGAYWPIEVVSNEIMLALSKGMPIYYGLDALKGAAIYNMGMPELLQPISIMLLFGVVCMGIGINLMERRA
ncbi:MULTISPECIES: ABC transporter permease [Bacillaceae]|uniref:ABC transporter permease n=1 Tax=Evansella alkalicola TaxID=745819 RepID=A0ABS6JV63_9BACI|nr:MULTISPECIES: ABC transporter permease [Bacillaceae]MBU9722436.1 ABC transporter permease [Bacillus alkalicola]